MNLESLKAGFFSYLQDLKDSDSSSKYNSKYDKIDLSEASIFMYAKEFKDYIQDEYNLSATDLSKSINDILKMEVVNGKLVDPNQQKNEKGTIDKLETDGKTESDKTEDVPETVDEESAKDESNTKAIVEDILNGRDDAKKADDTDSADKEELSFTDLFNAFLEDENFAKAIDTDGDGEYTQEELTEFFNSINSYDGDEKNLSIDDLLGAVDDIQAHNAAMEEEQAAAQENEVAASGPIGAFGGGGGIKTGEKNLDNMTREELNAELTSAQSKLEENQKVLEDTISGNTPELLQMQENIENAYQTYLDELESVDKEMAKELDGAVQDIEDKEGEITDKELEIADQENTVSESEGAYNNAVSTREALENQLGLLQAALGKETDEAKKSEIQSAISSVNEQIEQAKKAEETAKKTWDDAKDKLDDLNKEKTTLEEELAELNTKKSDIEAKIDEKYPEIAEYKNAYNEAKTSYDTAKANAINSAKEKVSESQKYVNDVKAALNDRDIRDLAKDNLKSISAFSQYNEDRGRALADAALSLYGNDYVANGNCAGGVADAIQKAFGYRTYGNGCDYGNVLSQLDDWVEVTQEITNVEDLKNLPAGAIVSWSTYEPGHTASNGRYGHVWISDGQGHEISDYIGNVSLSFSSWGASYRVFLPR